MPEYTLADSLPFDSIFVGQSDPTNPLRIKDANVAHQVANDLIAEATHLGIGRYVHLKSDSDNILPIAQAARYVNAERRQEETNERLRKETQKTRINEKWGTLNESAYEEDLKRFVGDVLIDHSTQSSQPDLASRHVIKIDMQMLNYFNALSGGHSTGDEYKRFVADTLNRRTERMKTSDAFAGVVYDVYLTGGDEFSILMSGDIEDVRRTLATFKREIEDYTHPEDSLHASGIDIGIATIRNVVERVTNSRKAEYLLKRSPEDKRNMISYLANNVADRASEMNKFMSRLRFLQRIHKTQPALLDFAIGYATKGAFQITKEKLFSMFQSPDFKQATTEFINEVFTARDTYGLRRSDDPFTQVLYLQLAHLRNSFEYV